ncbi:MAG: hypothetical protein NW201_09765 [Gemmatimonadales bacterium]|nr:hypothetical protein [Gemmatimonadales bacterium]
MMPRAPRLPALIASLLALAVASAPLAAQGRRGIYERPPNRREGFWISVGGGLGRDRVSLDTLARTPGFTGASDWATNAAVTIRLGGTVGEHWRLGAEYYNWYRKEPANAQQPNASRLYNILSHLSFIGQWYPGARTGAFLKGGAGVAFDTRTTSLIGLGAGQGQTGVVLQGGVGWELPVSPTLYVTPSIDYHRYWFSEQFPGAGGYSREQLVFQVSVVVQPRRE